MTSFGRKLFFVFIIFAFILLQVKAQDYVLNYEQFTTKEGLANNFVSCIVEDRKGFMWFGTQDGLCRYDGHSYKTYKTDIEKKHILLSNNITSLAVFNDSLVYVGTEAGLHILNTSQNTITPIDEFKKQYIHQIFIDNQKTIWIINQHKTIHKKTINEKHWKTLNDTHPELNGKVWTSVTQQTIDKEEKILLIYKERIGGSSSIYFLSALKEGIWQPIFYKSNTYIDATHKGNLIVVKDVMRYPYPLNKHLKDEKLSIKYIPANKKEIDRLSADFNAKKYQNKLYIPLFKSILVVDLDSYKVVNEINLEKTKVDDKNAIKDIFINKEGNLWVATFGQGVLIFPIYTINSIRGYRNIKNDTSGISHSSTRAIYKDEQTQTTWIGTYSPKKVIDIFSENGKKSTLPLYDSYAFAIKEDKKNKNLLWIATYNGIVKATKEKPTFLKVYFKKLLPRAIEVNSDSTLLFSDADYIYTFNTEKEEVQSKKAINKATYLYQDRSNIIWIGTETDGFASWDIKTDKITYYNPEKNAVVKSLHVKCIYEDTKGKFWIATTRGFYSFDKTTKKIKKFTIQNGLPNNVVYAILEDEKYNLWLSTNKGISKFNVKDETFENFDVNDGLQDDEYNTYSFYKSEEGELFFGGINGVDAFFPNDLKRNKHIPKLILTGFIHLGKEVKTDIPIEEIKEINLPLDSAQMLTFEFAALNFYQNNRNQYAYKIEELDTTWIQLGNKNEFTLTSLAAGNYTLRIKGSNNHGVWNEEGITLKITIIPPFWQQEWFLISFLVLFMASIYLAYKVRIYQLKRREEELELQIKERTKELAMANKNKDQLFAIIAHDLRSPLSAFEDVSNQIEYFIRKNKPERVLELGKHIDTSIQGLNILLNNLLNWALIQQNHKIQTHPQVADLSDIIQHIISIYQNVAQSNQIKIINRVETNDNVEIVVDIDSFQTILRNLISNALKYTPANGTVELSTMRENDKIILKIRDTGVGMSEETIKTIFEPSKIETNKGLRGEKGTGLGLVLCKEFAQINHIKIKVESEQNKGTIFYLTIPTP